jgi:hypothetical protein
MRLGGRGTAQQRSENSEEAMRRRDLLQDVFFISVAGSMLMVGVSACSDDDSEPAADPTTNGTPGTDTTPTDTTPTTACTNTTSTISANHGHTVELTAAELAAGAAVDLTLTLGSGHTHSVSLTAAELAALSECGTVVRASTNDNGHSHSVTFSGMA